MENEYIYRENVPVYIDGVDLGYRGTLFRYRDMDYDDTLDWFGHIAFTFEQALVVADAVNAHNDPSNPMDDYYQGRFEFDPSSDTWTEYSDNEGTVVYDKASGFDAENGERLLHLYAIGSDWCWSLVKTED